MGWDKSAGVPNLTQVILFCNNNGGAFLREDGRECLLTQPRAREALQFMQDLIHRHRVAPAPADVAQPNADLFLQGNVAWGSFGPASVAAYRRTLTFDWALGPVPLGAGAKQRSTVMDGSAWMLLATAPPRRRPGSSCRPWSARSTSARRRPGGVRPGPAGPDGRVRQHRPPGNVQIMLQAASERTYLLPQTPWAGEAESAVAPLLADLWAGQKGANVVAEEAKRLLDPILQKEFSFRTD